MQHGFLLLTETLTFQQMLLLQAAPFHLSEKKGLILLGHRNVATVFIQLKQCFPQGAGKQGKHEGPGCTSAAFSWKVCRPFPECSIKTSFNSTLLTDTECDQRRLKIRHKELVGTAACCQVLAANHSH